jgi:hypothetical protein
MTRLPLGAPAKTAMREFIDAVLALSDDPAPTNVGRYLAASQALEDSRPPRRKQARATTASTPERRAA